MNNFKIPFIFFGTPNFAIGVLDELEKNGFLPSMVVTAVDKPRGRKLIITPPEVKVWAEKRGIPVFQPKKLDDAAVQKLKSVDAELFIVAAYGKLIPKSILEIPKHGTLNVHPSLLPRLRGASPLSSSILTEDTTGVSILVVDEEMDHGPIIAQEEIFSWKDDLNKLPHESILENDLAKAGGRILAEVIPKYVSGEITSKPQDDAKATFTKKINKEDGLLDLKDSAENNFRKIRAFEVWPRAYFFHETHGKKIRVIVTDAEMKNGKIVIKKLLPEGGKEISYEEFLRRYSSALFA
ncbi:MAG: methionyl-tRNA formyltransferase [Candidatus Paceibacterota bacterium]|jgi:methionyl-tRNA formyltransferase|nr:methionyl-tRNA formyltransferase [Candidatus Paceibacterota bacterium]